jgi:hypothetical protein
MYPTALLLASLSDPAPISDNSFLIEEAYNQEPGVVQHIATFTKFPAAERWISTFTQEWPIDRAPRNQLSYTLSALSSDSETTAGFSDTLINWRYQVVNEGSLAFAPRASVILPTGSSDEDRSVGGTGADFNLPVSLTTSRGFDFHWNLGATYIHHTKNRDGDIAPTFGARIGQGLIWRAHPRIDGVLEILLLRQQLVAGPDETEWATSVLINPGIRWAHDLSNGLQIVPGVSFPIELEGDPKRRAGVLFYISFEHALTRENER